MIWWEILLLIPLGLGVLLGVAGSVLPILPGPPLVFACAFGYAWITGFEYLGAVSLVSLGVLVLVNFLLDQIAGAWGATLAGASRQAGVTALILGIIGFFCGPLWLVFVLPILGVALVELALGRSFGRAARAAGGVGLGSMASVVAKLAISLLMVVIITVGIIF
jgi:uncharacterized protein YqgC (DUF456 family)